MNLCIVQPWYASLSETFIQSHIDRLPASITAVHGRPPHIGDMPVLSDSLPARIKRIAALKLIRSSPNATDFAYQKVLKDSRADAVLAEYGPAGTAVMSVCERLGIPFIVHFHGYDACRHDVIREFSDRYTEMFRRAGAIVAVSKEMRQQLISLGAPAEKVYYNPYGVDCTTFSAENPASTPPMFLAVGRFVPKKAPHLLVAAFSKVVQQHPAARLRMIGDGPLLGVSQELASALGIGHAVEFLGPQPHTVVRREMAGARAFVQHSVIAEDGDREGTPNTILEAGASGLPVVSTYHAGIPDVVLHEKTGLLVCERDADEMSKQMMRLIDDPALAARLGSAARERITSHFEIQDSIERLWSIIEGCVRGTDLPPLEKRTNGEQRKAERSFSNRNELIAQKHV